MNGNWVHVSIGEVKVGTAKDVLKANLGSCVGIAFIWRRRGLYGLAHCLLPFPMAGAPADGARYVTQAIPTLVSLMGISPDERDEVDVVIAGGGNMMDSAKKANSQVGALNIQAAEEHLKKWGFRVVQRDVGGDVGKRITVDCGNGTVQIDPIPRIDESVPA